MADGSSPKFQFVRNLCTLISQIFSGIKSNFPWNIQTVSLNVAQVPEKGSILVFDQNYSDETLIQILNYHTIQAA